MIHSSKCPSPSCSSIVVTVFLHKVHLRSPYCKKFDACVNGSFSILTIEGGSHSFKAEQIFSGVRPSCRRSIMSLTVVFTRAIQVSWRIGLCSNESVHPLKIPFKYCMILTIDYILLIIINHIVRKILYSYYEYSLRLLGSPKLFLRYVQNLEPFLFPLQPICIECMLCLLLNPFLQTFEAWKRYTA